MYLAAIIDDEPIIAEGLSKVINWEKYDCRVVGTAFSGQEGLELIRTKRPDLIISDISMPGMDGLQMIAALRVDFPDMEICILTGYRDFDFCQRALQLGVRRFLLKPSRMEELEEALQAMKDNLDRKRREKESLLEHREEKAGESTPENSGGSSAENKEDDSGEKSMENAGSFIVKNAIAYMENHYSEHLSLNGVAEQIYVSQWHLSKLLNRLEQKSFSELLNQIRVSHAKELMNDPALRISDISEMVGFTDVAHFSRVFKKLEGISANEYRNRKL